MPTYIIGDVQGCFNSLLELLDVLHFNKDKDKLWFTGDLVNRGQQSLDVLNFVMNLPKAITVLGNHDLSLLALAEGYVSLTHHTLDDVLNSSQKPEVLTWLRQQPLIHYEQDKNFLLVHAGVPPQWDANEAVEHARETERILKSNHCDELLANLFGNSPDRWQDDLTGWDRHRYIINSLTRMRFCAQDGRIDLVHKGPVDSQSNELLPWFKLDWRKTKTVNIAFGHWAALNGQTDEPLVHALDTGCVWGKKLTAMRLEDKKLFAVNCLT